MKIKFNHEIILGIVLVVLGASARLLPHPANFAPLGAIAIFSGLFLPRKLALWLPLTALLVSDLLIGFYMWEVMVTVYLTMMLTTFGATKLNHTFAPIAGYTLASSILFFLTTNAAVWAFGTMYSHDLNGLAQSYVQALPFFRNSLMGDLFFTAVLVGAYFAVNKLVASTRLATQK